jgi:hypothetical protein
MRDECVFVLVDNVINEIVGVFRNMDDALENRRKYCDEVGLSESDVSIKRMGVGKLKIDRNKVIDKIKNDIESGNVSSVTKSCIKSVFEREFGQNVMYVKDVYKKGRLQTFVVVIRGDKNGVEFLYRMLNGKVSSELIIFLDVLVTINKNGERVIEMECAFVPKGCLVVGVC